MARVDGLTKASGTLAPVLRGDDVDLNRLPFVKWRESDGGRHLCGTAALTRDPESGYVNVGSYRFMLVDRTHMVPHIGSGHNGDVIRKKCWAQGRSCPIAIALGQEPFSSSPLAPT